MKYKQDGRLIKLHTDYLSTSLVHKFLAPVACWLKFCMLVLICGSLEWNLRYVTLSGSRILKFFLVIWKFCASIMYVLYNLLARWLAISIATQQKTVILLINDVKPIASSDSFFKLHFKFFSHFCVQFPHIYISYQILAPLSKNSFSIANILLLSPFLI